MSCSSLVSEGERQQHWPKAETTDTDTLVRAIVVRRGGEGKEGRLTGPPRRTHKAICLCADLSTSCVHISPPEIRRSHSVAGCWCWWARRMLPPPTLSSSLSNSLARPSLYNISRSLFPLHHQLTRLGPGSLSSPAAILLANCTRWWLLWTHATFGGHRQGYANNKQYLAHTLW